MNVTVLVPPVLRAALEGRQRLELGVPPTADVADVVQTLLALYPQLSSFVASDRRAVPSYLALGMSEAALRELARRRSGLKEGQVVYLFASNGDRRAEGDRMFGRG